MCLVETMTKPRRHQWRQPAHLERPACRRARATPCTQPRAGVPDARARAPARHRVWAVPDAVHVDPVVCRRADELLRGRVPPALAADHGAAGGKKRENEHALPYPWLCAYAPCGVRGAHRPRQCCPWRRVCSEVPWARAPRLCRYMGMRSEAGSLRPATHQRMPVTPRCATA